MQHDSPEEVFIREKSWKVLDWMNQSPDLDQTEHVFHPLKKRLQNHQRLPF